MEFLKKLKTSFIAVMAILALVLSMMLFRIVPFSWKVLLRFGLGGLLLIFGQALFLYSAEHSVSEMGKKSGTGLVGSKKLWLILMFGFIFGFVTTLAEPDISIFVKQMIGIDSRLSTVLLLFLFGLGVGSFVVFGLFRILKKIPLKFVLLASYLVVLILFIFAPASYLPLALDGSAVTTGQITAPFLLALTIGVASLVGDQKDDSSFGILSLASVGAVITILVLGIFLGEPNQPFEQTTQILSFGEILIDNLKNVIIVLLPTIAIFLLLQITLLKLRWVVVAKMLLATLFLYFGLVLFLTGVTFGFTPCGKFIGENLSAFYLSGNNTLVILLFTLALGFVLAYAEPVIGVLSEEVEGVTNKKIRAKLLFFALGIGIALSIVLAMTSVIMNIPYYCIVVPLIVASVALAFFIPQLFTGIAFDAGGIATGTTATAFILPLFIGFSNGLGLSGAGFGVIGIIAIAPIVVLEIMFIFVTRLHKKNMIIERITYKRLSQLLLRTQKIKSARQSARVFEKDYQKKSREDKNKPTGSIQIIENGKNTTQEQTEKKEYKRKTQNNTNSSGKKKTATKTDVKPKTNKQSLNKEKENRQKKEKKSTAKINSKSGR